MVSTRRVFQPRIMLCRGTSRPRSENQRTTVTVPQGLVYLPGEILRVISPSEEGALIMSQQTENLQLPFIQAAQAQKHVTHNEALEVLDVTVQLTIQNFDRLTPPANPSAGEAWALGATPVDAWDGQAGAIAAWQGGGWIFVTPKEGWRAWGMQPEEMRVYRAGTWGPLVSFDNLARVGINATADSTNRLAVSSDATLLNHAGSGHQVKVNKATESDTAALLYQTGFSGRAELGLAGNDDFSLKVSADGTNFREALRVDAATGISVAHCVTGGAINLDPDTLNTVNTPSKCGFVLITVFRTQDGSNPRPQHSGIFIYDSAATPSCLSVGSGPGIVCYDNAVMTVSTGAAGDSGISAFDGGLQLLNRTAETLTYNLTFLGGLPHL